MISMSQTYSIRQLRKSGESISEIARKVGVSRNTVYAKLAAPDLSPQMPVKEPREKMLDAYRPVIEGYLDEDERSWRKQRHTARRIWQRLRDEHGVACSESTVRHYVHDLKAQRRGVAESYLDLVWSPGEAQDELLRALLPVLQHGVRPGLPLRERRVRVPGAQADLRIRGRRPHQDRLRQRHRRRPQGLRRGQDHRDLRRVRRC